MSLTDTTQIDLTQFNETDVIKLLKSKSDNSSCSANELCKANGADNVVRTTVPVKSNRGRKPKYATDEERILARRAQQKAYRERKKRELNELRALKAKIDSQIE